jgi:hypothetical protein
VLRVDAGVRFAVVDEMLETLRKAGVRNVVLARARPEVADAPRPPRRRPAADSDDADGEPRTSSS